MKYGAMKDGSHEMALTKKKSDMAYSGAKKTAGKKPDALKAKYGKDSNVVTSRSRRFS